MMKMLMILTDWRSDIQRNGTRHNDTQHNCDTRENVGLHFSTVMLIDILYKSIEFLATRSGK
jgi:hypothetical protein